MEFDKYILSNNFNTLSLFNTDSPNEKKDLDRLINIISLFVQILIST